MGEQVSATGEITLLLCLAIGDREGGQGVKLHGLSIHPLKIKIFHQIEIFGLQNRVQV